MEENQQKWATTFIKVTGKGESIGESNVFLNVHNPQFIYQFS